MAKKVYLGMIGDIMHPGYINIINKAAEYGDVIIGLFTDKAIANHRPHILSFRLSELYSLQ